MATNETPVYLFTGFLEGGKTHIIQESLSDPSFNSGDKTLFLMCEEGEEELDPSMFAGQNCRIEYVENQDDINPENLTRLFLAHKTDRVVIEYNGMWQLNQLYQSMPQGWFVFQEMMFADASTFLTYNANMRQLMVDKLTGCEMVVLNRTPAGIDKDEIHKVVRGVSRRAQICYDYPDGHVEYDDIIDPLPFDLDAPVVVIPDEDYAVWYRDMSEELPKYANKVVEFKGMVARNPQLKKNEIAIGRHVMTCCEADIAYTALICVFDHAVDYKTREWMMVRAKIKLEKHKMYGGKGPVLYAIEAKPAQKPEKEVATFY